MPTDSIKRRCEGCRATHILSRTLIDGYVYYVCELCGCCNKVGGKLER
jgi:hypothetical protein